MPRFPRNSNPFPALSLSRAIGIAFQPASASGGDGGAPSIAEKPAALPRPCGGMRHCGRLFQPCAGFRMRPLPCARLPCDGVPFGHHAGAAPPSFMIILGGSHSRRDTLHGAQGCDAPLLGRMRPLGGHPDVAGLPECRITFVSSLLRCYLSILFCFVSSSACRMTSPIESEPRPKAKRANNPRSRALGEPAAGKTRVCAIRLRVLPAAGSPNALTNPVRSLGFGSRLTLVIGAPFSDHALPCGAYFSAFF